MSFETVLTFSQRTGCNYVDYLEIQIRQARIRSVADIIKGATDDRDGYGDAESAKCVREKFEAIRDLGVRRVFDHTWSDLDIRIRWTKRIDSVAPGRECSGWMFGRFEGVGGRFREVEASFATIKRIGRKVELLRGHYRPSNSVSDWSFDDPDLVIAALRKLKAVEVRLVTPEGDEWMAVSDKVQVAA